MKIVSLAVLLLLHPAIASAQTLVAPDVVRFENVRIDGDMKVVTVGNAQRHYSLFCNITAAGCITPERDKNYLLFEAKTRWKMPGAKDFITLQFVQDWTVKYNTGENIGLVPEDAKGELGMVLLDRSGGGYEQDVIFSDGPIIYGAGMSNQDRANAWRYFFLQMIEAVGRQHGKDALVIKLARRCLPDQDFCSIALDVVGIGGIQQPRKVVLVVATDRNDSNKQLSRIVCTWPAKDKQVCRDWDTGKLVTDDTQ